jgi:16S rRNA C967 or C1407 C5-methylase (RsmB/RsmF family)
VYILLVLIPGLISPFIENTLFPTKTNPSPHGASNGISPIDFQELLSELQFEILESASQVLKDEGELVYSTCTILKEENTENIKKFLKKYPEFETAEIYIPENVKGTYDEVGGFTIDYNEDILDGFYIAKIRKKR